MLIWDQVSVFSLKSAIIKRHFKTDLRSVPIKRHYNLSFFLISSECGTYNHVRRMPPSRPFACSSLMWVHPRAFLPLSHPFPLSRLRLWVQNNGSIAHFWSLSLTCIWGRAPAGLSQVSPDRVWKEQALGREGRKKGLLHMLATSKQKTSTALLSFIRLE